MVSFPSGPALRLSAIEAWSDAVNQGFNVDVIYLDFTKAFDKVPHQHLLLKLEAYGINGNMLMFIRSFLNERKQKLLLTEVLLAFAMLRVEFPKDQCLDPSCSLYILTTCLK